MEASSPRSLKNAVYEQLARMGKALASGPRLEILDLLAQSPRTVETLANEISQSVANTSAHLKVLRRARLVETERRGVYVIYRLASEQVSDVCRNLRVLAESRLFEIEAVTRQFMTERGALEEVDVEELVERVKTGDVTLIDVRPGEEYRAGHIAGAVSVPIDELQQKLAELPRDRELVAYCRGPYCVMAMDAVEQLRADGFRAVRLEEGVSDWRARGLPVEAS